MEVILLFIGGVVLFVGIYWFFGEVVRPLRQLQRLIRVLAGVGAGGGDSDSS